MDKAEKTFDKLAYMAKFVPKTMIRTRKVLARASKAVRNEIDLMLPRKPIYGGGSINSPANIARYGYELVRGNLRRNLGKVGTEPDVAAVAAAANTVLLKALGPTPVTESYIAAKIAIPKAVRGAKLSIFRKR